MIVAVIPAFNEPGIARLVTDVAQRVDRVIVVDEADAPINTGALAAKAGAEAIYSRGRSLRAAIELGWATTGPRDDVITMDGDGANLPSQIPRLLAGNADIVIGSRFIHGGRHSGRWTRQLTSRVYGLACAALVGLPVHDWGGGFRCYHGCARQLLGNHAQGHAYQAETLARAHQQHLTITEVPATYLASPSSLNAPAVLEAFRVLSWFAASRWPTQRTHAPRPPAHCHHPATDRPRPAT